MTVRRMYCVTKKQADWITKGAAELGISANEFLRRILDEYLATKGNPHLHMDEEPANVIPNALDRGATE